jgi:UDP-N-acetylmuramyl pentapeptide phosphotransferase/UDP-N-acetylglucosamine-1-phosphate transferase
MNFLLIGVIPFFMSFFLVYLIRCICIKYSILDQPNLRSSHQKPVALMGGIGIIVSVCISGMIFFPEFIFDYPLIIISLFCLAIVSVCDDIWTVPSLLRLMVHMGVGLSFYFSDILLSAIELPFGSIVLSSVGFLSVIMTVFYVVSWVNVYNFMDGMDGYAAMMAVIGLGCLGFLSFQSGGVDIIQMMMILVSVVAGFWVWNYPKAKIFMGDVGSATLGALVALITLKLNQLSVGEGGVFLWQSLLIFSIFWMDALVTLIRRICRRERVWEAHRDHFYQRLLRSGWSHQRVLLLEMGHLVVIGFLVGAVDNVLLVGSVWVGSFLVKFLYIETIFVKHGKIL